MDHFLHTRSTSKRQLREGAEAMECWSNTLGTDLVITSLMAGASPWVRVAPR